MTATSTPPPGPSRNRGKDGQGLPYMGFHEDGLVVNSSNFGPEAHQRAHQWRSRVALSITSNVGCHRLGPAHLTPVRIWLPGSLRPPQSQLAPHISPPVLPPLPPFAPAPRRHRLARHAKDRMRRQGQYGEVDISSMVAAQLHHYQAQQGVQQHPDNSYPGRDPAQASGEHQYTSPKVRQSQWDRGGPNIPSQVPSYAYNEGQDEGAKSFYEGQRSDLKVGLEKQPGKESMDQSRADRTETGYEDYNLPRTFEGLEQSFHEDIMMLSKELKNAEDSENSRHRERLNEINTQYQGKLLALRTHQATYREEFLRKESLARQQQYQQAIMSHYANNTVPGEQHGYHPTAAVTPPPVAAGGAYGDSHRGYASGQYESINERPDYPEFQGGGRGRGRGFEYRGQYPGGRAYNSGGRRF